MTQRMDQFDQLIQQTLGEIITKEVDFPKDCLVTITRVQTSADLSQAFIFVSTFPSSYQKEVWKILKKKRAALQKELNAKIVAKRVPKIIFRYDQDQSDAFEMEELLDQIKKDLPG